jgi:LPXTG-motif cell wall-anchored protein
MALAAALLVALIAPSLLVASEDRLDAPDQPVGESQAAPEEASGEATPQPEGAEDATEAPAPVAEQDPASEPQDPGAATTGRGEEGERPVPEPAGKPRASRERHGARAAQAASAGVDIRNFAYSPREITVGVGEAVRWTNRDREPHDAEAFDGSFKTSVLQRGQSDSVTFNDPGTFRYFCSIHPPSQFPNFTATVRVLGDGGGSAGAAGDPAGGAEAGGEAQASGREGATGQGAGGRSGSRLPATGLGLIPLLAVGLALVSTGGLLRRFRRTDRRTAG